MKGWTLRRSNMRVRISETEFRIGNAPPARPGSYARSPASARSKSGVSMESGFAVTV